MQLFVVRKRLVAHCMADLKRHVRTERLFGTSLWLTSLEQIPNTRLDIYSFDAVGPKNCKATASGDTV